MCYAALRAAMASSLSMYWASGALRVILVRRWVKKNLFDSLATLSCFDRRQSYFRGEYANALKKIVQNGDIHPEDMTGSWAGAFGQTQFMPSTFFRACGGF